MIKTANRQFLGNIVFKYSIRNTELVKVYYSYN